MVSRLASNLISGMDQTLERKRPGNESAPVKAAISSGREVFIMRLFSEAQEGLLSAFPWWLFAPGIAALQEHQYQDQTIPQRTEKKHQAHEQ